MGSCAQRVFCEGGKTWVFVLVNEISERKPFGNLCTIASA